MFISKPTKVEPNRVYERTNGFYIGHQRIGYIYKGWRLYLYHPLHRQYRKIRGKERYVLFEAQRGTNLMEYFEPPSMHWRLDKSDGM